MSTRRTVPHVSLSLLGLLATASVIAAVLALDGDPALYLEPRALLLVIAGTLAVTLSASDREDLGTLLALRSMVRTIAGQSPLARVESLVRFADRARRGEPRLLESEVARLPRPSVLRSGLLHLLEGRPDDDLHDLLAREVAHAGRPATVAAKLLARAADTAPAMGLVGTVIGLVQMLARLERPEDIGPGMAVALLTTLYGVLLAQALLLPLARRAEALGERARTLAELERLTVLAIARREPPAYLRGRLHAVLGIAEPS